MLAVNDIKTITKDIKIRINWEMFTACNYSCPYCIQTLSAGKECHSKDLEPLENYIESAKKISKIFDDAHEAGAKIDSLAIIGGEVTLVDIKKIISNITSKYFKELKITTNLSASKEYYQDLKNWLEENGKKLRIYGSYHPTQCIDAEFMSKLDIVDILNVPLFPKTIDRTKRMVSFAREINPKCKIVLQLLRKADKSNIYEINQEDIDELRNSIPAENKGSSNYIKVVTKDGEELCFNDNNHLYQALDGKTKFTGAMCLNSKITITKNFKEVSTCGRNNKVISEEDIKNGRFLIERPCPKSDNCSLCDLLKVTF